MGASSRSDAGATRSQAHLAERLGLARMTVQRALAGHASVRPATRDRILRFAQRNGYRPNVAALSMRSGRFGSIAVIGVVEGGVGHMPSQILAGVQKTALEQGFRVMIDQCVENELADPSTEPRVLQQLATDGLLVYYHKDVTAAMAERVKSYRLPTMWLNARHGTDCVCPDDWGAGKLAAQHLLALGHRRIGFTSHHGQRHYSILDRCRGAEVALRNAGLTLAVKQLEDGYYAGEGVAHVRSWLECPDRPTATICYSPQEAVSVCIAASAAGVRIPDDLSVVVFNDVPLRISIGLPISSFLIPFEELGRQGAQLLSARVTARSKPCPPLLLPFDFEDFGSTCPPKIGTRRRNKTKGAKR